MFNEIYSFIYLMHKYWAFVQDKFTQVWTILVTSLDPQAFVFCESLFIDDNRAFRKFSFVRLAMHLSGCQDFISKNLYYIFTPPVTGETERSAHLFSNVMCFFGWQPSKDTTSRIHCHVRLPKYFAQKLYCYFFCRQVIRIMVYHFISFYLSGF